jgi:hypothetical protein
VHLVNNWCVMFCLTQKIRRLKSGTVSSIFSFKKTSSSVSAFQLQKIYFSCKYLNADVRSLLLVNAIK